MQETDFVLNPEVDLDKLAADFAAAGRIHIPGFLKQGTAERLYSHLRARSDWRLVINQGEKLFELDREAQAALGDAERAKLELAVYQAARDEFQFRFETIRVPDARACRAGDSSLLSHFASFLCAPATLKAFQHVTGCAAIGFADAQATAYGPGHFLTAHDDEVTGKARLAAYVFNLTPRWRAEWGGLLMFHGGDGHIEEAYLPFFNSLNLFRVPQPHSVSYVVPYVPHRRYAVTGWLRSAPSDAAPL